MSFQVGDRVRITTIVSGENLIGELGTICHIDTEGSCSINFDNYFDALHNCSGHCEYGHGWWVEEHQMELIESAEQTNRGFQIGDRVKVISREGDASIVYGMIGTVVRVRSVNISVCFDEYMGGHSCDGNCESGYGWNVRKNRLEFTDSKKVVVLSNRKCSCCGNILPIHRMVRGSNKKYVCGSCLTSKSYSTENKTKIHSQKKHGKTYGFEFECIPYSRASKAALCDRRYNFIPTNDGSLPSNGVEFKSPIYYSLNGLKSMFKTLTKYADFENDNCGQHINIGNINHIDSYSIATIKEYSTTLFDPLYEYMKANKDSTIRICGRYFTSYADRYSYDEHSSWINLCHANRIEFRLSKMTNPSQYFHMICMWTEMVDAIIKWFLPSPCQKTALFTAHKLVKIFQKYEQGKAMCQRPERNKVA